MNAYPASPYQPSVNPAARQTVPQALVEYEFPAAMLQRLQSEQRWTPEFTRRAVHEYRRFLILAAGAGHAVTPSQAVDHVWHTHLTFTRDYWERLSPLLPAPLHHEPASAAGDLPRYHAQYLRTLDVYTRTFAQTPPADLWPDPRQPQAAPRPRIPRILWPLLAAAVAWMTFTWSAYAL